MSPQTVFDELLTKKSRPERIKNLTLIHKICQAQAAGSRDYSLSAIGKLSEAAGGISAKALYNNASRDYQAVIAAWRDHSGPRKPEDAHEVTLEESIAARISDPALRSVYHSLLAERNRVRAELDLLKSVTSFTVDRRTRSDGVSEAEPLRESSTTNILTPTERRALAAAVAPEFFHREGWVAGEHGEITKNGRVIFDVGFTRAIHKLLASFGAMPEPRA